jgi:metal-sulfur cluster biosynthetic enzyme
MTRGGRALSFFWFVSTMNGGQKDNANPVVKAVDTKTARTRKRRPLGWEEIQKISADPIAQISLEDPNTWTSEHLQFVEVERSPEDIAVLQALADVSALTGGTGVSLLTKAGVVIASPGQIAFEPSFRSLTNSSATNDARYMASEVQSLSEQRDTLDSDEVFDIIRNIQDPEHPLTLEQLGVVSRQQITVQESVEEKNDNSISSLQVRFTPTVPHCSMATLIGLAIQVKLYRSLPRRFKVKVSIEPGTHQSESAVNKQLQDKERVSAALENPHLLKIVNKCIADGMKSSM